MAKLLKKFWHWLRCEDENGNPLVDEFYPFKYSENIKKFPLKGEINDDDIVQISHKTGSDRYETCYVTIKQLKEGLK